MNRLKLLGIVLATVLAVSCGSDDNKGGNTGGTNGGNTGGTNNGGGTGNTGGTNNGDCPDSLQNDTEALGHRIQDTAKEAMNKLQNGDKEGARAELKAGSDACFTFVESNGGVNYTCRIAHNGNTFKMSDLHVMCVQLKAKVDEF